MEPYLTMSLFCYNRLSIKVLRGYLVEGDWGKGQPWIDWADYGGLRVETLSF